MKKGIIFLLLIANVLLFGSLYFENVLLADNKVFAYGRLYTLEEILHKKLEEDTAFSYYTFQRALVKEMGSFKKTTVTIDQDEIIDVGNRNLVIINGKLYVYTE